jgi:hypothetical protein
MIDFLYWENTAMMTKRQLLIASAAAAALATMSVTTIAGAQPAGPGWGSPMMGPGMMGRSMYSRMCSPGAAGFAEWNIDRLERSIRLTEAQRPKFDELKAASSKAVEAMRAGCPTEIPATAVGRMAAMEKRLDAMLAAVKTMRPAMDAFYATLNDEQKARLDRGVGAERFWRWRDHWWQSGS